MNISIKDFAKKIGKDKKEIVAVVKRLGIKKTVFDDEDQEKILGVLNKGEDSMVKNHEKEINELEKKRQELQQFHNQIIEKRDQLKIDQDKFEVYKKSEENNLKEKLLQNEINHKDKLEELRIKKLKELTDNFQEKLSNEYKVIEEKLIEIAKNDGQQKEQEVEYSKLKKEKELFESEKDKLFAEYKQVMEKDKEIFHIKLEEERLKQLEEINKKLQKLYEEKEIEIESKETLLRERVADLKTKKAEILSKEKYLESQEQLIEKQAFKKVQEEIKNYQERINSFENANQQSREELSNLREELDSYEKFEGRNLPRELDEKQQEIVRLKKELEKTTQMKNELLVHIDNTSQKYKKDLITLEEEKTNLLEENIKVESLKNSNMILEDKTLSFNNHIEFLKGENKHLKDRLESIYSDRAAIKEIISKQEPYDEIKLESQISITDEIKYLDSIEANMKKYGVEYPQRLLYAFHTALKSAEFSPLAVLSGVSGTGKSELPKLYSHFGGFNFLAEAVQPTWDSPEFMIGYYNTIERAFDSTNILKFLLQTSQSKNESTYGLKESMNMILLDEMNLAHIELYFAEFLSKFELRRGSVDGDVNIDIKLLTSRIYKLPLDKNVLWIGTMNEDETTKSLSDKVLDRSFSINFPRPTELKSRAKLKTLEEIKHFEYLDRNTWNTWIQKESLFTGDKSEVLQEFKDISNQINEFLAPTGRAIGHRVWQSMEYYISNHPLVIKNIDDNEEFVKNVKLAFEEQLVQKIMPKLRGIEVHGKEKDALMNIKDILNQKEFKITEDFELSMENPYEQFIWNSANYLKED